MMNLAEKNAPKPRSGLLPLIASVIFAMTIKTPARAVDEIQVYNAGIAAPGQLTIQQHLNFVALA